MGATAQQRKLLANIGGGVLAQILLDPLGQVGDAAQGGFEIVRGDVGELVELAVALAKLTCELGQAQAILAQLNLAALLVVDIGASANPVADRAGRVAHGQRPPKPPAIGAIRGTAPAVLDLVGRARLHRVHPAVDAGL